METITIAVVASKDHFGAFAENVKGIYGAGDTPDLAIANALEAIELVKRQASPPAALLSDYEIAYRYDAESLLRHYADVLSKPALERLTGINQKQLHHYASGLKKPRPAQRQKIREGLHRLGRELLSINL